MEREVISSQISSRDQQRWVVSCDDDGDDGDNYNVVNVKPANLKLAGPKKQ